MTHNLTLLALGADAALIVAATVELAAEWRWHRRYARQPHRPGHPDGNPMHTPDIPEGPNAPPHNDRRATPPA